MSLRVKQPSAKSSSTRGAPAPKAATTTTTTKATSKQQNQSKRSPGPKMCAGACGDEQVGVVDSLKEEVNKLTSDKEGLEKERDFYFNKLREIELICQENQGKETIDGIFEILYKTEYGFAQPEPVEHVGDQEEH